MYPIVFALQFQSFCQWLYPFLFIRFSTNVIGKLIVIWLIKRKSWETREEKKENVWLNSIWFDLLFVKLTLWFCQCNETSVKVTHISYVLADASHTYSSMRILRWGGPIPGKSIFLPSLKLIKLTLGRYVPMGSTLKRLPKFFVGTLKKDLNLWGKDIIQKKMWIKSILTLHVMLKASLKSNPINLHFDFAPASDTSIAKIACNVRKGGLMRHCCLVLTFS